MRARVTCQLRAAASRYLNIPSSTYHHLTPTNNMSILHSALPLSPSVPLLFSFPQVNDLEEDSQYERWPSDLQSLLMPMYPGRLPTVARNILNAVFAFDPASPAALEIGALLHQLQLQSWPLRCGLVPVVAARVAQARGAPGGMLEWLCGCLCVIV